MEKGSEECQIGDLNLKHKIKLFRSKIELKEIGEFPKLQANLVSKPYDPKCVILSVHKEAFHPERPFSWRLFSVA